MSRRPTAFVLLLATAALLAGCASGDAEAAEGRLQVEQVTVDQPPNPDQAALRFVIDNGTGTADTLRSVSSDIAGSATIHESSTAGGMATMVDRDTVDVPARSTVTFAPGGLHVMLEELRRPLVVGDTFTVTLQFDRAGAVTATAEVVELGSITADDLEHAHG